jgi:hypothetical protein
MVSTMGIDIYKICACGRAYTREDWENLSGHAIWPAYFKDGKQITPTLECRDCKACNSQMAIRKEEV